MPRNKFCVAKTNLKTVKLDRIGHTS